MNAAKPTILIVDDEPAIVSSIIRALEDDYECLGAPNAAEARKLFADHRITCVISDQRMPGEPGSEFLAWVRMRARRGSWATWPRGPGGLASGTDDRMTAP